MSKITRAQFLGFGATLAGAGAVATSGLAPLSADAQQPSTPSGAGPGVEPDLVVVNARAHTVDPPRSPAEAFAAKNCRSDAVGSTADMRNLATQRSQLLDAGGMTVTPGFLDTQCHVSGVGGLYNVNANVRRLRELQVNRRAKGTKT